MSIQLVIALGIGGLLAYANGSNDISKGIATLVGSGVGHYRRAVIWGTGWTAIGIVLGAWLGKAMLLTFGKGLIDPTVVPSMNAGLATLLGAAGWVFFASRKGLPVSTTHALVGSLTGVMAVAYGQHAILWVALLGKIALPLLLTPLIALLLTAALLRLLKPGNGRKPMADCVCVETGFPTIGTEATNSMDMAGAMSHTAASIHAGDIAACKEEHPATLAITLDHMHWLTSGLTSMARGMNDAPKIVALLTAAIAVGGNSLQTGNLFILFAVVSIGMIAGCLISGFKVTECLANKVTPLDHREGFAANSVTAALVTAGAIYGLPMSTTHVSSGAIISAGLMDKSLNQQTLKEIVMAWLITLPASALIGTSALLILNQLT